jgi:ATP-dependent DNA ligase
LRHSAYQSTDAPHFSIGPKHKTDILQARLKALIRTTQPYAQKIAHRGVWVEPSLLAEIEYRAKSAAGPYPFFKGIREDL